MLKDTSTGKISATKVFKEKHSEKFARVGNSLNKPFESEGHFIGVAASTVLTDDAADALLNVLEKK